jgi:hypothetical protein
MILKERDIRKMIAEFDVKIISLESNKHWKAHCEFNGKKFVVVISKTPSDDRALKNWKSWMKRNTKET